MFDQIMWLKQLDFRACSSFEVTLKKAQVQTLFCSLFIWKLFILASQTLQTINTVLCCPLLCKDNKTSCLFLIILVKSDSNSLFSAVRTKTCDELKVMLCLTLQLIVLIFYIIVCFKLNKALLNLNYARVHTWLN